MISTELSTAETSGIFNISSGQPNISLLDLATLIRDCAEDVLGRDIDLNYSFVNNEEYPTVRYSISNLERLNIYIKDTIRDEIIDTLKCLKENQ